MPTQCFLKFKNNIPLTVIAPPCLANFSGDIRPGLQDGREVRPDEHLMSDVQPRTFNKDNTKHNWSYPLSSRGMKRTNQS